MLIAIIVISLSTTLAYGILQDTGPQLDLVIRGNSIAEIQESYTIFIEAQDSRYDITPERHTIPYVDFTIQTTHGDLFIEEIEGMTQKNGEAAIGIFILKQDYEPWRVYNVTVSASYNNYSDTEQISFYLIEKSGKADNIKEQEE